MMPRLAAVAGGLAVALAGGVAAAAPTPSGRWQSPLGVIRVEPGAGEAWKGTLESPSKPCAFKKGDEVLRGTLLDDSLAGQLRGCVKGPRCKEKEEWAG